MKLHIASGLNVPADSAATGTFLIVGKRGSGKSSTATRFAEQLHRAKVPIAVLDPVDVWWGMKAGADGGREGGLENVYVFGGDHHDGVELEPSAGSLMADLLVDHRISAVFVLRQFSNQERARFVGDFADQLFRRNRDVLHLFCEEAHELMPQSGYANYEAVMLGRMLRLQKLGRTSGVGMTSITQRPASLNKNATTQAEVLVAHRIIGPQDIKAIDGWIQHHHQQDLRGEVLSTLPELKTGEAWWWAPDFPEDKPMGLVRVSVLMPETFDSRRTPKPGERRREPKALQPADIEKLRDRIAATIERTKENDPAALKKQVAQLKQQIVTLEREKAKPTKPTFAAVPKIVHVIKPSEVARVERTIEGMRLLADRLSGLMGKAVDAYSPVLAGLELVRLDGEKGRTVPMTVQIAPGAVRVDRQVIRIPPAAQRPVGAATGNGEGRLPQGERLTLIAAAQHAEGVTREQLTQLTGYKRSSRNAYVSRLEAKGFIQRIADRRGELIVASDEGLKALGTDYEPLPTGDALRAYWLADGRLPEGERRVLGFLCGYYPEATARENIDLALDYKRSSRNAYISRLVARRLVDVQPDGRVKAAETLFGP